MLRSCIVSTSMGSNQLIHVNQSLTQSNHQSIGLLLSCQGAGRYNIKAVIAEPMIFEIQFDISINNKVLNVEVEEEEES